MIYPAWKKIAWRFLRVFVAAVLIQFATDLAAIASFEDLTQKVLVSALTAGISALGKAVREWLASDDYKASIHRIII